MIKFLSPLDQFEIKDLVSIYSPFFNFNLSVTNIGLYLAISTLIIIFLNILATNFNKLVSNF